VLSSLQGVGAIAGGLTAPGLLRRIGDVRLGGFGMALFAVGDLSFVSSSLLLILSGIVVAGVGVSFLIVALFTAMQTRTPLRLQGRVASAADLFISTPQTISIAAGAGLVALVDYRVLVVTEALAVVACAAYLLSRKRESTPAATPAASPAAAPLAEPIPTQPPP
jgi:MFS family permease